MKEENEISRRYGRALFDFISEEETQNDEKGKEKREKILKELKLLNSIFKLQKDVHQFLFSPLFHKEEKIRFLRVFFEIIFREKISFETKQFIFYLNHKGRLHFLDSILRIFQEIEEKKGGVLRGVFYSVNEDFSLNQRKKWQDFLGKKMKKLVLLDFKKEASLLGGIRIQIGDFIIEDSFDYQLKKLKDHLSA